MSWKMTSAAYVDRARNSRTSPLERLPSEIKVLILLHTSGLSCLRNIVHASPAYHEAYLGAREEVLHVITTHILDQNGIGLLDPWTAVHVPQLGHDIHNRADIINEFLERYNQGRMDSNPRRLALQDSLAILNLHSRIAFSISKYCKAVFAKNPLTQSEDKGSLSPSQSELNRLHRAYWRYVIYSRLFVLYGWDYHVPVDFDDGSVLEFLVAEIPIAHKFLGLFPIHEVEELACLHGDDPIHDFEELTSLHRDDCVSAAIYQEEEVQDDVDQRPRQLYKVLTAKSGKESDASIDAHSMLVVKMRFALQCYEVQLKLGIWNWQGMHENFASDRVPTTGWLWANSRGIQNVDYGLRRWGYVFWDRKRLDIWNITASDMVN